MKNDIEQFLNELPPRQPSSNLDDRMATLFTQLDSNTSQTNNTHSTPSTPPTPQPTPSNTFKLFIRTLRIAAILALSFFLYQSFTPTLLNRTIADARTLVPHSIDTHNNTQADTKIIETWSNITPGQVVAMDDNTYVQPIQIQTLERVQSINSEKNVNTESYIPRNEIILVPVSFD